jgi:putative hydrolase of the HAD superfamily
MMSEKRYIRTIKRYASPLEPIPTWVEREGSLRAPVHAVLFDVYGTLFISGSGDIEVLEESVQVEKLASLLDNYGIGDDPEEVLNRYFARIRSTHETLREKGIDFPEVIIEDVWGEALGLASPERAREFALEYELLFNPVWPMPHLQELLKGLRSMIDVMGIISNAQFFTPLLFKAFTGSSPGVIGFQEELALYSYVYGHAKPSPFLFERARAILEERGIAAENTLYVGNDMLNDIFAAAGTGFQTALFAGDRRSLRLRQDDPRCKEVRPDITVIDLFELSDIIRVPREQPNGATFEG